MRTLFFRIFLWFWMAIVVLAVTFAGIIVTTRFAMAREGVHAFKRAVGISARAAAVSYEQQGGQGLTNAVNSRDGCTTCVYFFDQRLSELQGLSAPAEVLSLAKSSLASPGQQCQAGSGWIACGATGLVGAPYVLVMRYPIGRLVSGREWAILIPALMTVAALVCFWLARYLTQPISGLRRLTGRFADGDLGARIEDHSAYSYSEELQGLAHDFDHMAQRIEGLVEGQKQLLRDISHELRTPLTRIALAIGLSRQRMPGPHPAEFSRIDREIERLNQLIGQILAIARLDAGGAQEERQIVDLSELAEEVVRDAALEADTRGVSIRVEATASTCVLGNRELLRASIENPLRNAIRHTSDSSLVRVELQQNGGTMSLAIYDQGPGVPEEDLPRLFEPFFRSAAARLNHPDGTGLGLATTRRIVQWHRGSVVAHNCANGGFAVEISLPLAECPDMQLHPTTSPSAGNTDAGVRQGFTRVQSPH